MGDQIAIILTSTKDTALRSYEDTHNISDCLLVTTQEKVQTFTTEDTTPNICPM